MRGPPRRETHRLAMALPHGRLSFATRLCPRAGITYWSAVRLGL